MTSIPFRPNRCLTELLELDGALRRPRLPEVPDFYLVYAPSPWPMGRFRVEIDDEHGVARLVSVAK